MRPVPLAFAVFCLAIVDLGAGKEWVTLEQGQLISNPANDGDSFHVRVNDKEYIFRLYNVDAPEVNSLSPERLVAQAKYFGITVPQVIELGENAKTFMQKKLAEPFTVITRMANAMGRSNAERFYAFVQTKDGELGEQLVANGLARVYGKSAKPPGVSTSAKVSERLQQLASEAKAKKLGGWASNLAQPSAAPSSIASSSPPTATASTPVPSRASTGKLDVNSATEKELRDLPGIGPILAQRIIAARPYHSADELKKVSGIGKQKYAKIREFFE